MLRSASRPVFADPKTDVIFKRVFQELRRPIEGKIDASLEEKRALVDAWLTDFAASPKRIQQLCGWHWIREALLPDPPPIKPIVLA